MDEWLDQGAVTIAAVVRAGKVKARTASVERLTNDAHGPSRHLVNPALTAGSSGGATAVLAAGFSPIALDGSGSGRRPALR